jgi:hypothetical protein
VARDLAARARADLDTEEVSGPAAAAAEQVVADPALADLLVQVAAARQVPRYGMDRWAQEWNPERAEPADGRMQQAEFEAAGRRARGRARWRWKPA